jgi:hypothetical protein
MPNEITALEERINGDILGGLKELYERVGALAVPVEQAVASHLRTLLGEAGQVVKSTEESPAAQQAIALAAEVVEGKPVGTVEGAGQAVGGGNGTAVGTEPSAEQVAALNALSEQYEQDRAALLATQQEKPQEPAKAPAPPLPPLETGGSPTGTV